MRWQESSITAWFWVEKQKLNWRMNKHRGKRTLTSQFAEVRRTRWCLLCKVFFAVYRTSCKHWQRMERPPACYPPQPNPSLSSPAANSSPLVTWAATVFCRALVASAFPLMGNNWAGQRSAAYQASWGTLTAWPAPLGLFRQCLRVWWAASPKVQSGRSDVIKTQLKCQFPSRGRRINQSTPTHQNPSPLPQKKNNEIKKLSR